jgi:ADP-heptose:LPS heptosyltransferase
MEAAKRILLVQLFSNGDCLFATTVARQIKNDYPDCYLIWMVADYCKSILQNNPFIDEVVTISGINHINWQNKWKSFKRQLSSIQAEKKIDETVFTQIIDRNFANYDYCIRSTIFRGYNRPITVPVKPVVRLTQDEISNVRNFADQKRLSAYKAIILFEFAPRSGQAQFTKEQAIEISERLVQNDGSIAFILSSDKKLSSNSPNLIDGSGLTLRETAYLTHYCTHLVGCSSGITWISTSDAAKELPMVQLLDSRAYWLNSVVNDHTRLGLPTGHIIEMADASLVHVSSCLHAVITKGFSEARKTFHEEIPKQFRITRGIIVYLLSNGDISGAMKHIRINLKLFGRNRLLVKSIILGITTFPIMIVADKFRGLFRRD